MKQKWAAFNYYIHVEGNSRKKAIELAHKEAEIYSKKHSLSKKDTEKLKNLHVFEVKDETQNGEK